MNRTHITRSAQLLSACGLCWAVSAAEPPTAARRTTFFVVERGALSSLLVDPKDAALARALSMVPERVHELPREIPDFQDVPMPIVDLVLRTLARPARLAVNYDPTDMSKGFFGAGLLISLEQADQRESATTADTFGSLLEHAQIPFEVTPVEGAQNQSQMVTPLGAVRFGARESGGGAWRYEVSAGNTGDPDAVFGALPAAMPGFSPVLRGRVDFAVLSPLFGMLQGLAANEPQAQQAFAMVASSGLVGPDAMSINFLSGHTADATVSYTMMEGYGRFVPSPHATLTDSEINVLPADSTSAFIMKTDITGLLAQMDQAMAQAPEVAQGLAQFKDQSGVDLRADVLGAFGGTFGAYLSESTGAGRLHSLVFLASITDEQRFTQAHSRLTSIANSMIDESPAKGHIRIREWQHHETAYHTVSFPGLPVPFELTYSVANNWLVCALSPQAATTAVAEIRNPGGLLANGSFRDSLPAGKSFTTVSFIDTAKTMRGGYSFVTMIGAAVGNMVRSPLGAERDPGMIVPPYAELAANAKPTVSCGYWDGDNYISETRSDRSMLVNAAGVIGAFEPFQPLIAAAILGGVTRAREGGMHAALNAAHQAQMEAELARLDAESAHQEDAVNDGGN